MAQERKLDIFRTLNHIDRKDQNFYGDLSEEEKKGFLPVIVARWMSGTSDAKQVYILNEIVNPYVFSLHTHKELLYQLMTVCTSGRTKRYFWNKTASNKQTNLPETIEVIKEYFGYSTSHARDALKLLSKADILDCAEQLGRQKDEIAKITKELKKI